MLDFTFEPYRQYTNYLFMFPICTDLNSAYAAHYTFIIPQIYFSLAQVNYKLYTFNRIRFNAVMICNYQFMLCKEKRYVIIFQFFTVYKTPARQKEEETQKRFEGEGEYTENSSEEKDTENSEEDETVIDEKYGECYNTLFLNVMSKLFCNNVLSINNRG